MALINIPKLPEGLHPFLCVLENNTDKRLVILSGDEPITRSGYDGNFNNYIKALVFNDSTGKYEETSSTISSYHYAIKYSNHDVLQPPTNYVYFHKTTDATEIEVVGGDTRNMQKGMIWNLGAAVSVLPSNALQACTFETSDSDVCTVDEKGKIVAVGEGECIITITSMAL